MLEWRWRIPQKTDDKEWKRLEAKVAHDAAKGLPKQLSELAAEISRIDKQIAETENRHDSDQKQLKLKRLRSERTQALDHKAHYSDLMKTFVVKA
jgi:hypothetical protein